MIVLYILLGLILLITLLLCVPVHVLVKYGDVLELDIRYLFIKLHILPAPEKPQEEPEPEKEEKKPKQKGEKKPNPLVEKVKKFIKYEGFGGFFQLIGDILKLTGTTAVNIIRHIRVHDIDIYVMTGGEDAAAAAILYGKACAAVYPAAEMLLRLVKCKKHRVSVDLDYSVAEPYVKAEADISIRPVFPLHYALCYVWGIIPMIKRFFKPRNIKGVKPVQTNNSASQKGKCA